MNANVRIAQSQRILNLPITETSPWIVFMADWVIVAFGIQGAWQDEWIMNEKVFYAIFLHCKAILGRGQPALIRWILVWIVTPGAGCLLCLLACSPAHYHCAMAAKLRYNELNKIYWSSLVKIVHSKLTYMLQFTLIYYCEKGIGARGVGIGIMHSSEPCICSFVLHTGVWDTGV